LNSSHTINDEFIQIAPADPHSSFSVWLDQTRRERVYCANGKRFFRGAKKLLPLASARAVSEKYPSARISARSAGEREKRKGVSEMKGPDGARADVAALAYA